MKYAVSIIIIIIVLCVMLTNSANKKVFPITTAELKELSLNKELLYIKEYKNFNQLFYSIDTISLETTSESLIDIPGEVRINDRYIIVSDMFSTKRILVFNKKNGKFLANIGRIGKGPGEYSSPELIELIGNELIVYDPILMKTLIYNVNSMQFSREWKNKRYYSSVSTNDGNLVFLTKKGFGYKYDFEIFDLVGNSLERGSFPKSLSESKWKFLYAEAFKINKCNKNTVYIGADEFRLILSDNLSKGRFWGSSKISGLIKAPQFPQKRPSIKWFEKNYSFLLGLLTLESGLILVQVDDYFHLYDTSGNLINSLKNDFPNHYFCSNGSEIYEFTTNQILKNNELLNPNVIIHKIKK